MIDPALTKAVEEFSGQLDAFSRIQSINRYVGPDDAVADMQLAYDVLDDAADVPKAITQVLAKSRKLAVLRVKLTEDRTEDFWRTALKDKVHIMKWDTDGQRVAVTVVPRVGVQGLTAVGVLESEDRWRQVQASMARISKRIETADAHSRRSIIACYGPSLTDTVRRVEEERWESGGVIVSVSGSHDFLIERGIIPDYHVECDPRPHKADNIARGHRDVKYLMGSCVHERVLDKLDGFDVSLWHVGTPEHNKRFRAETQESAQHIITGGGSVGLRSVPLMYAMGYRDFSIHGMDCSFAGDGEQQWAGKHAGEKKDVIQATCGGRTFATSPVMLTYATDFIDMTQKVSDAVFRVYGDGLLQTMCVLRSQLSEKAE